MHFISKWESTQTGDRSLHTRFLLAIDQWSMAWTYWKVPYRPLRQQWWIYYILSVWCINDDIKHNINFTKQSPLKWLIKIIFEWRLNTADIKPCSKNRNTVVLIIYTICKLCPIIHYRYAASGKPHSVNNAIVYEKVSMNLWRQKTYN